MSSRTLLDIGQHLGQQMRLSGAATALTAVAPDLSARPYCGYKASGGRFGVGGNWHRAAPCLVVFIFGEVYTSHCATPTA